MLGEEGYDMVLPLNIRTNRKYRHGNGRSKCKVMRARWRRSIPVSWPHPSLSGSATMFGCSSVYWLSRHASSVQPPSLDLAQTTRQDLSLNDISGPVCWCNDSCEEFSILERSRHDVIHRLAAETQVLTFQFHWKSLQLLYPARDWGWWVMGVEFLSGGPRARLPACPASLCMCCIRCSVPRLIGHPKPG